MSSKMPTVRQVNWWFLIPQLLIMAALMGGWYFVRPESAMPYGAGTYLLISFMLRNLIPRDHRKGMTKLNAQNFEAAIEDFKKSYAFFKKYEWIDQYRYATLLSSSGMPYREMALINIGFSYLQIGNASQAKTYYQKALAEFPKSAMAKVALNMITTIETHAETP